MYMILLLFYETLLINLAYMSSCWTSKGGESPPSLLSKG